jgi:hypothetical protein
MSASPRRRSTVLLSYFALRDLPALLNAVRETGLAKRATVHVGSYGVNRRAADQVHEADCSYAPMLALARVAPRARELAALTSAQRVAAGRTAGRAFRDQMRSPLFPVETWQFDELSRDVARSRPLREFARGVLDGLFRGRAQDRDLRGFVWLAAGAFGLPLQPIDAELQRFWEEVGAASLRLVGEEFPAFVGDPRAAARAEDAGRRALASGGPIRRSLGRRYAAGITPGYRLAPGLGGNVEHRSRTYVNRWRSGYLTARRSAGVGDFAAFNFRFGNAAPQVMADVLTALKRVL